MHIAPGFNALTPTPLDLWQARQTYHPEPEPEPEHHMPHHGQTIGAGSEHAVLLRPDGQLLACGNGFRGRMGNGDEDPRLSPALISWPGVDADEPLPRVVSVAAGAISTAVVTAGGELYTFGVGGHGVLGHGDRETVMLPASTHAHPHHNLISEAVSERLVVFGTAGCGADRRAGGVRVHRCELRRVMQRRRGDVHVWERYGAWAWQRERHQAEPDACGSMGICWVCWVSWICC